MHTTCWFHIINLLADEVRGEMTTADRFIAEMKCAFTVYEGIAATIRDLERENIEASSVWPQLNLLKQYMVTLGHPPGKLDVYMETKHPAVSFWKNVQLLDIRKCT